MNKYKKLEEKLGISFRRETLIKQAFIHRSYLNEVKQKLSSNERLEFLGDSILSYLTSVYLFLKFPDLPEGELTNLRSSVVKTTALSDIAKELNLGDYLYLSKGEEEGGGRKNYSLLADTFEALLGAVYLDSGPTTVQKILQKLLFPIILTILAEKSYKDAKSSFQEIVQETGKVSPVYRVVNEEGPDHAKEFTIGVYVDGTLLGTGGGKSKQEAEQAAAAIALEKWKKR